MHRSMPPICFLSQIHGRRSRHHKRRFVSPTTLGRTGAGARSLEQRLSASPPTSKTTPTGRWPTFCARRGSASRRRVPAPGTEPYPGWQPTRYEDKARLEGRNISFYFRIHPATDLRCRPERRGAPIQKADAFMTERGRPRARRPDRATPLERPDMHRTRLALRARVLRQPAFAYRAEAAARQCSP